MSLKIETLTVGQLATNCYLIWDESKKALIIDPGDSGDYIAEKILSLELKPKMIIVTHAHFDHLLAALELKLAFKIPLLMNLKDSFILKYMGQSAKYWLNLKNEPPSPSPEVDRFLKEGDQIKLGKSNFRVLATPGHTPGSISLYYRQQNLLFSGDSLFKDGFGRTDLPGGSEKELIKSLKRLLKLPPQTRVFPGHGPETTIGKERKFIVEPSDL